MYAKSETESSLILKFRIYEGFDASLKRKEKAAWKFLKEVETFLANIRRLQDTC
jgi:hypothetical protein